jgi:predicted tellurium resistance membrane protein TerC
MAELFTSENLVALLTLTLLEIVLGIDNLIFISILAGKLPEATRARARLLGLGVALGTRILLLLGISWVMGLKEDLFHVRDIGISGRDLILICGGLFLIAKSTHEIRNKIEHEDPREATAPNAVSFAGVVVQIGLVDIVFSLDSVITAVGMVDEISIMIVAVIVAIIAMMAFAGAIGDFVERHPTIKMLALAFLILIGTMLVAEGFDQHINKGYIYFAMAFALAVELLNMRVRKKAVPMIGGVTGNPRPGAHPHVPS